MGCEGQAECIAKRKKKDIIADHVRKGGTEEKKPS